MHPKKSAVPKLGIESKEHKDELLKLMGYSPRQSPDSSLGHAESKSHSDTRSHTLLSSGSDIKIIRSPKFIHPDILKLSLTRDVEQKKSDIEECKKLIEKAKEQYNFLVKNLKSNESAIKRAENKLEFFDVIIKNSGALPVYLLITKSEESFELSDLMDIVDKLGYNIIAQDAKIVIHLSSDARINKKEILSGPSNMVIGWIPKNKSTPTLVIPKDDSPRHIRDNISGSQSITSHSIPKYEDCYESLFISDMEESDFKLDLSNITFCDEDAMDGSCRAQTTASSDVLLVTVEPGV